MTSTTDTTTPKQSCAGSSSPAPSRSDPAKGCAYSNLGYVLLGFIIRQVTGEFYGDFLQNRIFQPLGMTTTLILTESDIVPIGLKATNFVEGQLRHQDWVSIVAGEPRSYVDARHAEGRDHASSHPVHRRATGGRSRRGPPPVVQHTAAGLVSRILGDVRRDVDLGRRNRE